MRNKSTRINAPPHEENLNTNEKQSAESGSSSKEQPVTPTTPTAPTAPVAPPTPSAPTSPETSTESPFSSPSGVTNSTAKEPFYKKTWFAVLLVFLFPPVGIILMWVYKKPEGKSTRIALTVVAALLIVIGLASMSSSPSTTSTNGQNSSNTSTQATSQPQKTVESISATYSGSTEAGTEIDTGVSGMSVEATYEDGTSENVYGWSIDNPSELKAGQTSEYTVNYEGQSCTVSITCTTLDEKSYKKACKEYSYDELARDPDEYLGEKVTFTGEVIQVIEDSSGSTYRINVTKGDYGIWDDTVLVTYSSDSSGSRILEDDIVTFYGVSGGLYTYESTMGASITVPLVAAEYIDIE